MEDTLQNRTKPAFEQLKKLGVKAGLSFNIFDHEYFNKLINKVVRGFADAGETNRFQAWDSSWDVHCSLKHRAEETEYFDLELKATLQKGVLYSGNIGLELTFLSWQENNYLLMPGAVYHGNRFRSRPIRYSPKLQAPGDIGPDKPTTVSDIPRLNIEEGPSCIQLRSGAMTVPSVGFRNPDTGKAVWMLFPQQSELGDYGVSLRENRDRTAATLGLYAPLVRELYQYRITNNHTPSKDKPHIFREGDVVSFRIRLYFFDAPDIHAFFAFHQQIRNELEQDNQVEPRFPFSSIFPLQEEKFNKQNYVPQHGYYAVGMRENFLQDWQIGWTGGMITTYPLLFHGGEITRNRVLKNFQWLIPDGIAPSGFFYDSAESTDGETFWYGGDIRSTHTQNWHLVRKSGDGLYYMLKQLMLMEKMDWQVDNEYKTALRGVADAFVRLWRHNDQLGQFVHSNTGEIVVGGSTSGAIVPAALMYAYVYFGNATYRKVAQQVADYFYSRYIEHGITNGGVGDALQAPDSESAYAMLESFTVLYEQTREQRWLERAKHMAWQFASWVCGYNFRFPEKSLMGKLDIKTTGSIFANAQNTHAGPGICTHSGVALFRLFRATGNTYFIELLRRIILHMPQLISHPLRPIPHMDMGWLSERINTTDWLEGIGETMYGSTWSETSLMLAYTEVPGLYVQVDKGFVFAFDQLQPTILENSDRQLLVRLRNTSEVKVRLLVFAEKTANLGEAWFENRLYDTPVYDIESGDETEIAFAK